MTFTHDLTTCAPKPYPTKETDFVPILNSFSERRLTARIWPACWANRVILFTYFWIILSFSLSLDDIMRRPTFEMGLLEWLSTASTASLENSLYKVDL